MSYHTTDWKPCPDSDGLILAPNNGKYTQIGAAIAIIHYNNWIDYNGGCVHQVSLTLPDPPFVGHAPAARECAAVIRRLFPELLNTKASQTAPCPCEKGKFYIICPPHSPRQTVGHRGPFDSYKEAADENDRTMGKQMSGCYVWQCPP